MIRRNDEHTLPEVIPPRSVVRLVRATDDTPTWKKQLGREFRIGYYSSGDGTDTIWLVNDRGEYEQTTDRASFAEHFAVVRLSNETSNFGEDRPKLGPLRRRRATATVR